MKFSCEKHLLQAAIATASRAAASKSPISALEGLLISAAAGVRITGYDLKKGIYTNIEAQVEQAGDVVVNAKLFGEMIRRMPDGMVSFVADEDCTVHVKCGKSEFRFVGISAEDYPEMPQIDQVNSVTLPQKLLKSMINQSIFAVSDNDVRPIYTGILFEVGREDLTLVAVDGYRLARRVESLEEANMEECSFVVPGSSLTDVERICSDDEKEKLNISVGKKHISFTIGQTVIISRRLEGEFLNHRKSVPTTFKYKIEVSRAELISSIERVSIIVSERNNSPVRMTFNDGSVDCLCLTPLGKAEDVCLAQGDGEGLEIGFNDRYMTDALKAAAVDNLHICLNSASSPCVISAADGSENFTYMILPVRLRAAD